MSDAKAKAGDTVRVHYTGKLNDGTVFDSSAKREPLEFKLGEGQLIPGFENAVVGMSPGDTKSETILSDQAYGPHRDEMIAHVNRKEVPTHIDPKVGQIIQIKQPEGETFLATITKVTDDTVTLDANHPLAGKDLTFEITLVSIL